MSIERLSFAQNNKYNAIEASNHLARYFIAKNFCSNANVLDVACGEGYGSYLMAQKWHANHVTGVDISDSAINSAKVNFNGSNIDFKVCSGTNLTDSFKPGDFNLIVSFETFEHISDPDSFIREIQLLSNGAADIIISCPNDYWYYPTDESGNPFHYKKYTLEEFVDLTSKYLGPPSQILLGAPTSGFCNFDLSSNYGDSHADHGMVQITNSFPAENAYRIASDEFVNQSNCAYYVCVWNNAKVHKTHDMNAIFYPCSMNSSAPAIQNTNVNNLLDEVTYLRTEIFESNKSIHDLNIRNRNIGLRFAASEAENSTLVKALNSARRDLLSANEKLNFYAIGYSRYIRMRDVVPVFIRLPVMKFLKMFRVSNKLD